MHHPSLEYTPYLLLALSILSLWIFRSKPLASIGLAVIAVGFAFLNSRISIIGCSILGFSACIVYLGHQNNNKWIRIVSHCIFLLLAIGLFTHQLPGFNNLKVLDHVQLSANAISFSMYLNFDKPFLALLLLPIIGISISNNSRKPILKTVPIVLFPCTFILFSTAMGLKFVQFEPKMPSFTILWLFNNLILVCIAEEALFRGHIQRHLTNFLKSKPNGKMIALCITSLLFGCMHYLGGLNLVVLSTIAGLFYGYGYLHSNRIEVPILIHFGVNAIHFFFFTYPAHL